MRRQNKALIVVAGLLVWWWSPWSSGGRKTPPFPQELAVCLDKELQAVLQRSGSAGLQPAVVMADGSV